MRASRAPPLRSPTCIPTCHSLIFPHQPASSFHSYIVPQRALSVNSFFAEKSTKYRHFPVLSFCLAAHRTHPFTPCRKRLQNPFVNSFNYYISVIFSVTAFFHIRAARFCINRTFPPCAAKFSTHFSLLCTKQKNGYPQTAIPHTSYISQQYSSQARISDLFTANAHLCIISHLRQNCPPRCQAPSCTAV